jgi:hypothetical protein
LLNSKFISILFASSTYIWVGFYLDKLCTLLHAL